MEYLLYVVFFAVCFGFATRAIIHNKGYDENWFWWGFFFGIFALIVACAKPQNVYYTDSNPSSQSNNFYNYTNNGNYISESERIRNRDILNAGGWQCPCGRLNANYVSTCTCGKSKNEVRSIMEQKDEEKREDAEAKKQIQNTDESAKVSAIKKYKELLDEGIISQEEFETKKKQLLGL